MAIGILLILLGIDMFCALLFTLAVYALPIFIGLSAGLQAFDTGGGVPGAIVVGLVVAAVALVAAQVLFAVLRSASVRLLLGLAFAAPAAVAGYHAALGLAAIGVPSEAWQQVFAVIGAVAVGATALARLQSTIIRTTIRQGKHWRHQQFSWIGEWEELVTWSGRAEGTEFVLSNWFYQGVLDRRLLLTIDPAYFALTGGT